MYGYGFRTLAVPVLKHGYVNSTEYGLNLKTVVRKTDGGRNHLKSRYGDVTGTDCSEMLEYGYGIHTENGRKIYQIEWQCQSHSSFNI